MLTLLNFQTFTEFFLVLTIKKCHLSLFRRQNPTCAKCPHIQSIKLVIFSMCKKTKLEAQNIKDENMKNLRIDKAGNGVLEELCSILLAFLFFYSGIVKLYDWKASKLAMFNQVIPEWSILPLTYSLPFLEILLAILLLLPSYRFWGFLGTTILLSLFTGYVAFVWLGFADRVPCSCGGVISSLTWGQHLIFNLSFLLICLAGWGIRYKSGKIKVSHRQYKVDLFKKKRNQIGQ